MLCTIFLQILQNATSTTWCFWMIIFLSCFYPFALQIFYFIGFGLFCIETLISIWVIQVWLHLLKFQIILSTCTQLTYSLFHWFPYSKYTCTSVAVVRLLRWNGRLLGEHWGLLYDLSVFCRRHYGYIMDQCCIFKPHSWIWTKTIPLSMIFSLHL